VYLFTYYLVHLFTKWTYLQNFHHKNILESTGTKLMYSLGLLICTALATLINSSEFTKWLTEYEHNGVKLWEQFCCVIDKDCVSNFKTYFSKESNTSDYNSELGNGL